MTPTDALFDAAEQMAVAAVKDQTLIPEYERLTKEAREAEGASGWKGKRGMTQVEKILNHLRKNGSITQREAYIDYGIQSFHRRLTDLREAGYKIAGVMRKHPVTGQEYTRYYLVDISPMLKALAA